ncbi:putative MO25-like protein [Platanthera guangdongensis]|uniref:MO25-like protein n=1 Tax=Platanthera guangdongensis TaxID=2320717 RepID=A0ABR2LRJ8_9ASPA
MCKSSPTSAAILFCDSRTEPRPLPIRGPALVEPSLFSGKTPLFSDEPPLHLQGAVLPPSSIQRRFKQVDELHEPNVGSVVSLANICTKPLIDDCSTLSVLQFCADFNEKLLSSANYITKRQAIKLLGEMLLDRSNSAVMMRYVSSKDNLMILMNLLRVQWFLSKVLGYGSTFMLSLTHAALAAWFQLIDYPYADILIDHMKVCHNDAKKMRKLDTFMSWKDLRRWFQLYTIQRAQEILRM